LGAIFQRIFAQPLYFRILTLLRGEKKGKGKRFVPHPFFGPVGIPLSPNAAARMKGLLLQDIEAKWPFPDENHGKKIEDRVKKVE